VPGATFVKGISSRWFTFVLVFYICTHCSTLILDRIFMLCWHLDKTEIKGNTPIMAPIKSVVKTTIGNTWNWNQNTATPEQLVLHIDFFKWSRITGLILKQLSQNGFSCIS